MTLEERVSLLEYRQELTSARWGLIKLELFNLTASVNHLSETASDTKELTKLQNRIAYIEKLIPDTAPKSYSWQLASLIAQ